MILMSVWWGDTVEPKVEKPDPIMDMQVDAWIKNTLA